MTNLHQFVIYRLYTALKGLKSLSVVIETTRNLELFNNCITTFEKRYDTWIGSLLESTPLKYIREIHWQQPYYLHYKEENIYDHETRGFNLVIDKTHRRYKNTQGVESLEKISLEMEEVKRLSFCEGKEEHGFQPTLATLRLLEELPLNPVQILWGMNIEPLHKETYLEREAIRIRCKPLCPAFLHQAFSYEILFIGDYQEMLVDVDTGVLLTRQVFLDGLVAEQETITSLKIG